MKGISKNVNRFKNDECPTLKESPCSGISNTPSDGNIFKFIFVNCYLRYVLLVNTWCSTFVETKKNTLYCLKYLQLGNFFFTYHTYNSFRKQKNIQFAALRNSIIVRAETFPKRGSLCTITSTAVHYNNV